MVEEIVGRLIEARHKAKMSLEDIRDRTKIPLRQLEYLEACQFDKIGPSVYVKGFIRRYAQEVGFDEYSLWQVEERVVPVTSSRAALHKRKMVRFNIAPLLRIVAVLALVVIVGFLIRAAVYNFLEPEPPAPPDIPPSHEDPEPSTEAPPEEPELEITLEVLQADSAEAIYVVHNALDLDVTLTFSGNCWTRITSDDGESSSATFMAGHIEQLPTASVLRIRFGAPKFVTVSANGLEIPTPNLEKGFNLEIRLATVE